MCHHCTMRGVLRRLRTDFGTVALVVSGVSLAACTTLAVATATTEVRRWETADPSAEPETFTTKYPVVYLDAIPAARAAVPTMGVQRVEAFI